MTGYSWTVSDGGSITSGASSNTIIVTWTSSGTKTITAIYSNGTGCVPLVPGSYSVHVNPFTPAVISGSNSICGSPSPGNVYSTNNGMSGYQWSVSDGGLITNGQGTNSIVL